MNNYFLLSVNYQYTSACSFSHLASTNCLKQNIIHSSRVVILISDWKNSDNYLLSGSSEAGLGKINEHAIASRNDKIQQEGKERNNRS